MNVAAGLGLRDRVAIVTGAASGIGRAVAVLLARRGAKVLAADLDADGLATLPASLDPGASCATLAVDVSDRGSCEGLVQGVLERHQRLDILVNAAAVLRRVPMAEVDEALWDELVDVNLKSQFLLSRAAARPMKERRWGRIVNFTSTAAFNGGAKDSSVYAASKGASLGLTKSLARELAPFGICVNAVCPGGIDTPMGWQGFSEGEMRRHLRDRVPLGRQGRPEEVATAVAFLVSDWASYVTGHTLDVEGGLMMR
ncbi:MAG: SDR family oxidoreductase [Proteobacteria bacterium]|nr:SDR family oxidoreductase [Pseudomonadota bacterium]